MGVSSQAPVSPIKRASDAKAAVARLPAARVGRSDHQVAFPATPARVRLPSKVAGSRVSTAPPDWMEKKRGAPVAGPAGAVEGGEAEAEVATASWASSRSSPVAAAVAATAAAPRPPTARAMQAATRALRGTI